MPGLPPHRKRRWPKAFALVVALLAVVAALINHYNVDKTVTAEDRHYVQLYVPGYAEGCAKGFSYAQQIDLILLVQKRVQERTTGWTPIPEGHPREPKDLFESRSGQCFDRSRVLEKIFLYFGFQTRHLSLFMREPGVHSWQTLLFHHVESHAISEVQTRHGWMMIDSNNPWVSLSKQGEPISMHRLQAIYLRGETPEWRYLVPSVDLRFYNERCIPIYGLYSRHGRFYPPYTSGIPDYRVRGLLFNLEDE